MSCVQFIIKKKGGCYVRLRGYEEIMAATVPEQIFSMNSSTIDEEFKEYCEQYRPDEKFHEVRNFVVIQQLKLLHKKAMAILSKEKNDFDSDDSSILLYDSSGKQIHFHYDTHINQRICNTYSNEEQILMIVDSKYEDNFGCFSNFIDKIQKYFEFWSRRPADWQDYQYAVPNIIRYFRTKDKSKYVLILQKPCRIYHLRDVLDYFDGRMNPRIVISILKRLYLHACYIDIAGMTHNAICVDNIYFSPGNEILPGKKYTVEDIRIVGLFGGWFFTTDRDEIAKFFPKEISDCIPQFVGKTKHSSFEVDMLSIKKVARELLGDVTGRNLFDVPSKLCEWFNKTTCEVNVLKEFEAFEKICQEVYGTPRFINIDVSI